MCITNRDELHPWRSTRPGPVPVTPGVDAPAPAPVDAAGPSGPRRRRRSGQRSRQAWMERHRAARVASQRDTPTSETPPAPAPAGERVVPEPRFPHSMRNTPHPPAQTWQRTRTFPATTSWGPGTSSPPPMTSSTTAPPASCRPHLAWIHGVGLLRRTGPGDVPAVSRRRELLVRLLRRLQRRKL
jgi:hypothetical protein